MTPDENVRVSLLVREEGSPWDELSPASTLTEIRRARVRHHKNNRERQQPLVALAEEHGFTVTSQLLAVNTISIEGPCEGLEAVLESPLVKLASISEASSWRLYDSNSGTSDGGRNLGAIAAKAGLTGFGWHGTLDAAASTRIAIIDTGIYRDSDGAGPEKGHCIFDSTDIETYDCTSSGSPVCGLMGGGHPPEPNLDPCNHGTSVAHVLVGQTSPGCGVSSEDEGILRNDRPITVFRVSGPTCNPVVDGAALERAINHVTSNPESYEMLILSLGSEYAGSGNLYTVGTARLDNAARDGMPVVIAAGNSGTSSGNDLAQSWGGISVGAADSITEAKSVFSPLGPGWWDRVSPMVLGFSNLKLASSGEMKTPFDPHDCENCFKLRAQGTSFAAPSVAATMVHIMDSFKDRYGAVPAGDCEARFARMGHLNAATIAFGYRWSDPSNNTVNPVSAVDGWGTGRVCLTGPPFGMGGGETWDVATTPEITSPGDIVLQDDIVPDADDTWLVASLWFPEEPLGNRATTQHQIKMRLEEIPTDGLAPSTPEVISRSEIQNSIFQVVQIPGVIKNALVYRNDGRPSKLRLVANVDAIQHRGFYICGEPFPALRIYSFVNYYDP